MAEYKVCTKGCLPQLEDEWCRPRPPFPCPPPARCKPTPPPPPPPQCDPECAWPPYIVWCPSFPPTPCCPHPHACCHCHPICAEFRLEDMDCIRSVKVRDCGVRYVRSGCTVALAVQYEICLTYIDNSGCRKTLWREGCAIFREISRGPCEKNIIVRFDQPPVVELSPCGCDVQATVKTMIRVCL